MEVVFATPVATMTESCFFEGLASSALTRALRAARRTKEARATKVKATVDLLLEANTSEC